MCYSSNSSYLIYMILLLFYVYINVRNANEVDRKAISFLNLNRKLYLNKEIQDFT